VCVFFFRVFLSFFSRIAIGMFHIEEERVLVCKDEKEFRNRLKKSFSAGETSEPFSSQQCLICCNDLKSSRAKIARKCLMSAHPCGGHACECAVSYCENCLVSLLWKSPRSHKGLGRYRAGCPFCKAEFCHFDVARVVFQATPSKKESKIRVSLMRVCDDEERAGVVAFLSEFNKGEGVENVVQRFAASATERLEVTFSSTERKLAHQLAEELGLGHESVGEGEQRVMVLTKAANFAAAVTDAAVFRGYLALCGPSVEFIASKFAERVPQKGLAKSERKL
jgi:hypothetical protein